MFKKILMIGALMLAPMAASSATVPMCDGGVPGPYDINSGDIYNCDITLDAGLGDMVDTNGGSFEFFSNIIPMTAVAVTANIGVFGDTFETAVLEWYEDDGFGGLGALLASVNLNDLGFGFEGKLSTTFSGPAPDHQHVRLAWTGFSGDVLDVNLTVAAIPVPAAGLLLITALGGLGIARRRRKAA